MYSPSKESGLDITSYPSNVFSSKWNVSPTNPLSVSLDNSSPSSVIYFTITSPCFSSSIFLYSYTTSLVFLWYVPLSLSGITTNSYPSTFLGVAWYWSPSIPLNSYLYSSSPVPCTIPFTGTFPSLI